LVDCDTPGLSDSGGGCFFTPLGPGRDRLRNGCSVKNENAAFFPPPFGVALGFQSGRRLTSHVREKLLWQPLSGLAVGARFGRAWTPPLRHTVRNQAGDSSATRIVGAQYLSQEDPQRDERRKDPIQPNHVDRIQCARDQFFRKHVAER
ncbi:MAG: hypothetical protein SGJ19_14415, partial [Planctomycetia bacterium]|nr:hypothetical protein [Planctomycetia bacterium]